MGHLEGVSSHQTSKSQEPYYSILEKGKLECKALRSYTAFNFLTYDQISKKNKIISSSVTLLLLILRSGNILHLIIEKVNAEG